MQLPGVHKTLTLVLQATLLVGVILFCFQGRWMTAVVTSSIIVVTLLPVILGRRFVALFAFMFAVGMGALWEIFEFGMDQLFGLNMQKSGLVDTLKPLSTQNPRIFNLESEEDK